MRFSCQEERCPISGAGVFGTPCRTQSRWFAAIAQLVEHVIRNDGVTGSSPVCGTTSRLHLQPEQRGDFLGGYLQRSCSGRQVGVKAVASTSTRKRQGVINEWI